jgi:archaeosine synthase beta-subunit
MMELTDLEQHLRTLYRRFGPPKAMGESAPSRDRPHFFLHRNFLGEQDLTILFNTKRCQYQCKFCALPFKSSREWIAEEDVLAQFRYVIDEVKHGLGVIERITLANEGSVLDETTYPAGALTQITAATRLLPSVYKLVLETRLEFVRAERLQEIREISGKRLDVLTGFETRDPDIRERVLGKRESLEVFEAGLDIISATGTELTCYVLFKSDPAMDDGQAWEEAEASISYLQQACRERTIQLTIRLNPMYVAKGTAWARRASSIEDYQPPRLSDVISLAEKKRAEGLPVYLGLTSEGLSNQRNTYRGREDFTPVLLKQAIIMNGDRATHHVG